MNARTLVSIVVALACAVARGQDAVRLHQTARVEPGRPLLLRDLAAVEGPTSDRLGALLIVAEPAGEPQGSRGWIEVDLERVRSALAAELGDKAGMVALSGSTCSVRLVGAIPIADAPGASPPAPPEPQNATQTVGLPTLRGAIARELCRILGAEPESLRLAHEAGEDEFLDLPIEGRIVEIAPTGSSDRLPVSVTLHGPDGTMLRRTLSVVVEMKRAIAVAGRTIERGREIGAPDILVEERWLPPGDPAVSADESLGAVARRRIKPGEVVERHAVEPPVVVHRGDLVSVRVVSGRWVVRRQATATEDGSQGDEIEFAGANDSRDRFRALITGRGQAIVRSGPVGGTLVARVAPEH